MPFRKIFGFICVPTDNFIINKRSPTPEQLKKWELYSTIYQGLEDAFFQNISQLLPQEEIDRMLQKEFVDLLPQFLPEQIVQRSVVENKPLTEYILDKALQGPTKDLEDNIQLHSAAEADCDFFITRDRQLLALGYFGKTKITNRP